MNIYETDVESLTCSCLDWKQQRAKYALDNPKRLCKHLIDKLDVEDLPESMKYFKENILYYKEKEIAFNKQFQTIIPL
ncbi:hypothetical protein JHD49_11110, partial [Sulfurimonas sp. SAG-AH-194-C21]